MKATIDSVACSLTDPTNFIPTAVANSTVKFGVGQRFRVRSAVTFANVAGISATVTVHAWIPPTVPFCLDFLALELTALSYASNPTALSVAIHFGGKELVEAAGGSFTGSSPWVYSLAGDKAWWTMNGDPGSDVPSGGNGAAGYYAVAGGSHFIATGGAFIAGGNMDVLFESSSSTGQATGSFNLHAGGYFLS